MNIQQLQYFLTLAETLNFTKTAEKYYISQTAISNQIKALEERLEVKLFIRDNRQVTLTQAGKTFIKEAKGIIAKIEEAVIRTREAANGFIGKISIGYQHGFERTIFPKIIQNFQYKFQNIELILARDEVTNLYEDLIKENYDLIFNLQLHNKYGDKLQYRVLKNYPLFVAVPPNHPLAQFHSLKREQLKDEIFISFRRKSNSNFDVTRAIIDDFVQSGYVPKMHFHHYNFETILLFVALGKGITIIPEYFIPCAPSGINLLFIPLEDSVLPAELAVVWSNNNQNPALIKFLDSIDENL